ncbi:MAG: class I SAM-dependent methyltransferase [Chloroflexi bacterium]|nr:class I SAM-dependent methyltransferase [Chloroflexota bacterium]
MARPVAAPSPVLPGSFRDPSGFVFRREGTLCRQVNVCYREAYEHLMGSGLYRSLTAAGLLIPHEEVPMEPPRPGIALMVIRPDMAPFVSYPYEWCFSELKDAALALLRIQKMSLDFGMSLKDCSAYNVQFVAGRPVLIDTLSFEKYREGQPWVAYRQFCQHFLAPLALMSHRDVRLGQLLRVYIDGVPLDLASSLLPFRTRLTFSLLSHIHLHARSQKHFARATGEVRGFNLGRVSFRGLIDSLESATNRLEWRPDGTQWADYYKETSYSPEAFEHKRHVVAAFIERTQPASLWDLGANTGEFSRLAGDRGIPTISFDLDPAAVEKNYLQCQKGNGGNVLPLVLDLSNPSPAIGWENEERMSLVERGPADAVMALALAHHLAIANNVPLDRVARFLSRICRWLIIEFVPKSDPQVQRMLATREDIFSDYDQAGFESGFREYFVIEDWARISGSDRVIYLMRGSR